MADIINLRRARKAKARDQQAHVADVNRLHHGRSKVEKQLTEAQNTRDEKQLDGHKRQP